MSELIQDNRNCDFRWKLLTGASAVVLMGYFTSAPVAKAEESDRPTVWIEIGGEFNRLQDSLQAYSPPFLALIPSNFPSPQVNERPPRNAFDVNGSVLFQPEGSSWHFSAAIRSGRSVSNKHSHHETYPSVFYRYQINPRGVKGYFPVYPIAQRFVDADVKQSESHAVIDFDVGKDVGLGLFNSQESSLNVGIRFAQFQSKSRINLHADPDWHFSPYVYTNYFGFIIQTVYQPYHSFAGSLLATRSFTGVGPSISWSSSASLAGNKERGELTFDFGMNGAVLFGRQKTQTHHQTTSIYKPAWQHVVEYQLPATPEHTRSRNVAVPNLGGFAGVSFRYPNVKVSFGYKADFFFGAMDGGIDVRRTEDVGFHGPYASVSIGLGG